MNSYQTNHGLRARYEINLCSFSGGEADAITEEAVDNSYTGDIGYHA